MTEAFAIDERLLPPQLRALVNAIGVDLALQLLRARGGTELRLPKRGDRSGVLIGLVGREAAEKVVSCFPGQKYIRLPKADKIIQQLTYSQIRAELDEGQSVSSVALKHDLTIRQVQKIRQLVPGDEPQWRKAQGELFGAA